MTDQEAYAGADAVFTGRLVQRQVQVPGWRPWKTHSSGDLATLVFEVSVVNKGKVSRRQDLVTASEGASCGLGADEGREYLVFARSDGGVLRANLCGGTRPAGEQLSIPFVSARPPIPGDATGGLAPSSRGAGDGLPVEARVAIAAGLTAPIIVVLLLTRRRRRTAATVGKSDD